MAMMVILLWLCSYQDWNLVENGSFDEFDQCFKHYGQIQAAVGWEQSESSSADYFNSNCSHGETVAGVPKNYVGFQEPHSGSGYAGLYLFSSNFTGKTRDDYFYREHIQTILKKPLQKGEKYRVQAFLSLAESSNYYTDKLSFCFSKAIDLTIEEPYSLSSCRSKLTICDSDAFTGNYSDWHEINGIYTAQGGETVLTISLFAEDLTFSNYKKILKKNIIPDPVKNLMQEVKYCYYYIDDVSVVPVSDEDQGFTHY